MNNERFPGEKEEFEVMGRKVIVEWHHDSDTFPWEFECAFSNSQAFEPELIYRDKYPYEVIVWRDLLGRARRVVDYQEIVKEIKASGLSGEDADKEAQRYCKMLQDWFEDRFCYLGYTVKIEGIEWEDSLWGIHSRFAGEYLDEIKKEAQIQILNYLGNFKPEFYPLPTA